jgi:hypothetical protein
LGPILRGSFQASYAGSTVRGILRIIYFVNYIYKIIKLSSSGAGGGEHSEICRHEWATYLALKRVNRYGD